METSLGSPLTSPRVSDEPEVAAVSDVYMRFPLTSRSADIAFNKVEQEVVSRSLDRTRRVEKALAMIMETQQTLLARTNRMEEILSRLETRTPAQQEQQDVMLQTYSRPPMRSDIIRAKGKAMGVSDWNEQRSRSGSKNSGRSHNMFDMATSLLPPTMGARTSVPAVDATLTAVVDGDVAEVQELLDAGLDPNTEIQNTSVKGHRLTHCSLLAAAVMADNLEMAELLIHAGAHPDSSYGFLAGANRMKWSGSAAFIAVTHGNLDMLQHLVNLRADPHFLASNNANLIWQAAYVNQISVLQYLIYQNVRFDVAAGSQNMQDVTFVPLHTAVVTGSIRVVEMLLECRADMFRKNERNVSPLDDAILYNHPKMVNLMVASHDDTSDEPARRQSRLTNAWLQLVYKAQNPMLMRAVAAGLQEHQVGDMSVDDVLRFLSADIRCLGAFFFRRKLRYRDAFQGSHALKTAMFVQSNGVSDQPPFPHVALSKIRFSDVEASFKSRQQPSSEMWEFFRALAPMTPDAKSCNAQHIPIGVYECVVPDMHDDLRILDLLSGMPKTDKMWLDSNCQAIFRQGWNRHRWMAITDAVCQSLLLMGLSAEAYLMMARHEHEGFIGSNHTSIQLIAACGIPLFLNECVFEILQMLSYVESGGMWDYFGSVANIFDGFRILADGCLLAQLIFWDEKMKHNFVFRVWFGGCCFFKWTKLVYSLSPFRKFGFQVLPVLHALSDLNSFILIMLFYLAGVSHAMVATDFLRDSVTYTVVASIYFGLMGDPSPMGNFYNPTSSARDIESFFKFCLYVLTGFALPVTLMNIFIAALCDSYSMGKELNENLFMYRHAQTVTSQFHMMRSLRRFCGYRKRKEPEHLWYCADSSQQFDETYLFDADLDKGAKFE